MIPVASSSSFLHIFLTVLQPLDARIGFHRLCHLQLAPRFNVKTFPNVLPKFFQQIYHLNEEYFCSLGSALPDLDVHMFRFSLLLSIAWIVSQSRKIFNIQIVRLTDSTMQIFLIKTQQIAPTKETGKIIKILEYFIVHDGITQSAIIVFLIIKEHNFLLPEHE